MKKIVAQFYKDGKLKIEVVAHIPFGIMPGIGRCKITKGRFPSSRTNYVYSSAYSGGGLDFIQRMESKAEELGMELKITESGEYEEPPPDDGTIY